MHDSQLDTNRTTVMMRLMNVIERAGNRLPDPFILFVLLALFVMLCSWLVHSLGVTVVHPGTGEELAVKSLVSKEGFQFMLTSMVSNFVEFKPLGIVLTLVLGVGLAERVSLLESIIKKSILHVRNSLVTFTVVLFGIMGNLAADSVFVIVPPLAAMVFYSLGRHPFAGLAAGFASSSAGFSANLIIANTDAVLSGISTEAAKAVDPNMVVTPVDNWFFMAVSTVILALVGTWITERIVEPKLGTYEGRPQKTLIAPSFEENKALRYTGIAALLYIALLGLVLAMPDSPLRNENGGFVPSPLLQGIVPILLFFFLTVGITYGIATKKIKNASDMTHYMGEAIKSMSGYIVLIFAIAQFLAYFDWSNLGIWIAVSGAEFLTSVQMTGLTVIIAFVLLTAVLNLLITSGSALWALESSIFVPMFMLLGYHPAFIQAAYRIADSSTNPITPLNPFLIILLGFMREYDKKAGLGTLMSIIFPYSVIFLVTWTLLLIVFVVLDIPFGPGIGVYLP